MERLNKVINKKGISIVEYSLLIAATVAAMVGAQIYIKRSVSGYWRQSGDTFGFGRQYQNSSITAVSTNTINTTITVTKTTE